MVKALSVRQPWAECIARGAKLIENRTRNLNHRGPLAIHAGLSEADEGWSSPLVRGELAGLRGPDLVHGAVLAVAELVDVHRSEFYMDSPYPCCGSWAQIELAGEQPVHHLVLADVRRLTEPVPARGQLGLFDVDDHLIRAALEGR